MRETTKLKPALKAAEAAKTEVRKAARETSAADRAAADRGRNAAAAALKPVAPQAARTPNADQAPLAKARPAAFSAQGVAAELGPLLDHVIPAAPRLPQIAGVAARRALGGLAAALAPSPIGESATRRARARRP